MTLLEALRSSLVSAAKDNPGEVVAPAAVLSTDADGKWRPAVEKLCVLMPELLTLAMPENLIIRGRGPRGF